MKKIVTALLTALILLTLVACNQENTTSDNIILTTPPSTTQPSTTAEPNYNDGDNTDLETPTEPDPGLEQSGSNILITYFGVPETDGVDTVAQASRVAADRGVVGNTQYVAQAIQSATGGDLYEITTVKEYPRTHDALLDEGYNELNSNERPELATHIENLDSYDTIFIGYPNWNANLPMALYTFLEEYDFGGKTIIPFVTHGGSGFSRTISTIQSLQPDATVITDGLSVSRNSITSSDADVNEWVQGLGLSN